MDIHPLRQVRLYEQIAQLIRGRIVNGELTQGFRLPNERDLAAAYGVSRNVVREAVRALVKDGLIEVRQGSGTYVADGTSTALGDSLGLALSLGGSSGKNLSNLIEIRTIIEPTVAGIAARRATKHDIAAMEAEIETMEGAFEDVDRFIAADHRFHVAVAKATQNHLVPMILVPVVDVLNEQRKRLFFVVHSAKSAQAFHKRILAAIRKKDSAAAIEAMRGHMKQVSGDINRWEQSQGPSAKTAT
jgi:GntR family transcriptional regulator, transcriptional repressor for pyruvate dehydrogenase complex